ncbi:MAG: zinc-dependent alcohol dehydrogenase, partial [Hyphomicrobium sp.]
MKQLFQNLRSGALEYLDSPVPAATAGAAVIATRCSLISAGTERMLTNFAKSGYIAKARQQPDKVKQVLKKLRTDGPIATFQAVSQKLDQPIPLGYSNVGVVVESGRGSAFRPGDRVVSNGAHAEAVRVPDNLAVKIPDGVSDEAAAFTIVGAIGLQGIRLIAPTLGETVCVAGLGLIGLMAVQMLKANGCRVFGFDPSPERVALARRFGAQAVVADDTADLVGAAQQFTDGIGVDAVLIT